jgi:hypothetical protein
VSARTGTADLPLHSGYVPAWLASRMSRLGRVLTEAIVYHYGRNEFLRRLSHPFWFQSFGCVMGMDWHSSGITTSVMGALKKGLAPIERELGIHVCGGKGRHSRATPAELLALGDRLGLDGGALSATSRLVAKVDSVAVQDGFDIYLHTFVVTDDGEWAVIQQGMNARRRQARRYHWLSTHLRSFVETPHTAIEGPRQGIIANLTDPRADTARAAQIALIEAGPDVVMRELRRIASTGDATSHAPTLWRSAEADASVALVGEDAPAPPLEIAHARNVPPPHLALPAHHDVRAGDIDPWRLRGTLAAAAARCPRDFADLLQTRGVGARTVLALALVAEVIHGAPYRFSDPARFSLAHGGKDGHPFPVPLDVYDETLRVLRCAVESARLGHDDRLAALRRLDDEARRLERAAGREGLAYAEPNTDLTASPPDRRMLASFGTPAIAERVATSVHATRRERFQSRRVERDPPAQLELSGIVPRRSPLH